MSDVWYGWKITEEQRLKMEAGDREACDRFYFENYNHLRALAINYAQDKYQRGFGDLYRAEDLMADLYIAFPRLNFKNFPLFRGALNYQFYRSAFSDAWTNYPITSYRRDAIFNTKYWIDEPRHDNKPDEDERIIDKFVSTGEPFRDYLRYCEGKRQERLEEDLQGFLQTFLTQKQLEIWNAGRMVPAIEIKLRRHAAEVIAFLRAHGTKASRLKHEVLPVLTQQCPERKARYEAFLAHRAWEEEHLDELTPQRRAQVLRNKKHREARKESKSGTS